jgi:hypothetical protein
MCIASTHGKICDNCFSSLPVIVSYKAQKYLWFQFHASENSGKVRYVWIFEPNTRKLLIKMGQEYAIQTANE